MELDTTVAPAKRLSDKIRTFDQLPDSANVGLAVVRALFNCSGTTVWRRCKDGTIPKPYMLSAQARAWNVGQLRATLRALQVLEAAQS